MFLKPDPKYDAKVELNVTHEATVIFNEYAKYIGISPDELFVRIAIDKLLKDNLFLSSIKNQRYNKKILKFLEERKLGIFENDVDDSEVPFKG